MESTNQQQLMSATLKFIGQQPIAVAVTAVSAAHINQALRQPVFTENIETCRHQPITLSAKNRI